MALHDLTPMERLGPYPAYQNGTWHCTACNSELQPTPFWTVRQLVMYGKRKHGVVLCMRCFRRANEMLRSGG